MNLYRELRKMEDNDNDRNLKKKVQELEDKLKKCSSDSLNSQSFIEKNNLYYYAFFGGLWQQPQEYTISPTKYCGIDVNESQNNFENKRDDNKNKFEDKRNNFEDKRNNDKNNFENKQKNNNKPFQNKPFKRGDNNPPNKNVITLQYIIPSSKDLEIKKDSKPIDSKILTIPFVVFDKSCLRVNRKKNINIEFIRMLSNNKILASVSSDTNIICENTTGSNNFNCKDCVNCTDCWDCVNCENCTNCIGLVNCKNCINSESCESCVDCGSCFKSKVLKNCVNCFNCEELVNSVTCYQCKFLGNLIDCTRLANCEYCVNCIDCSNTRRSDNCINVDNSYDCNRSFDLNNCSDCIGCIGCSDSSKLKNCTDTSMSTNSNNCVSCVACKFSTDLIKCTEMDHCKYCKYSNKCYNSSWILYSDGITSSNTCYRCSNLEDSNVNYYCKNSSGMYFCIDSETCTKCKNTVKSNQISNSSNVFGSFDINDSNQCYNSKNITHSSYCVSSENIEYSNYAYNSVNLSGEDDVSCGYRRTYSDTFIEQICSQNGLTMEDITRPPKQKLDDNNDNDMIGQIHDNQFKRKKSDYNNQDNDPDQNKHFYQDPSSSRTVRIKPNNISSNDMTFENSSKRAQRRFDAKPSTKRTINLSKQIPKSLRQRSDRTKIESIRTKQNKPRSTRVSKFSKNEDQSDSSSTSDSFERLAREHSSESLLNLLGGAGGSEDDTFNPLVKVYEVDENNNQELVEKYKNDLICMKNLDECTTQLGLLNAVYMSIQADHVLRGIRDNDYDPDEDYKNILGPVTEPDSFMKILFNKCCMALAYYLDHKDKFEDIESLEELKDNLMTFIKTNIFYYGSKILENLSKEEVDITYDLFSRSYEGNFDSEADIRMLREKIPQPYFCEES